MSFFRFFFSFFFFFLPTPTRAKNLPEKQEIAVSRMMHRYEALYSIVAHQGAVLSASAVCGRGWQGCDSAKSCYEQYQVS